MSRTRRIYNSEKWKRRTVKHYESKYTNSLFLRILTKNGVEILNVNEQLEKGYPIWASAYCYHPYKELCMGYCHSCSEGRERENKHRRRMLRKQERECENL